MTRLQTSLLVLATAIGATAAFAGDRIQDQIKLQLKDGSCLDPAAVTTPGQDRDCLNLQDGSCLLATDETADPTCDQLQLRERTRTGADNGQGDVVRTRSEGAGRN
ncbi:MAG: hypothetical protein KDK10_03570 [Maritimibacter sp.]|nr:hypothetical protein [Maritimibacter sp.]